MKLIIGLGNPGDNYAKTRHNIGFMLLERLAREVNIKFTKCKTLRVEVANFLLDNEKNYLVKPTVFVNESGDVVYTLLYRYGLSIENLLIVCDDLDMEIGKIRWRRSGSSGGHNGVRSIIQKVGSQKFERVKIGIGRPKVGTSVSDYVLSEFTQDDYMKISSSLDRVSESLRFYLTEKNFEKTMSKYNGRG